MNLIQTIHFPTLNAALNATTAVLLLSGYVLIRRKQIHAHRRVMTAAVLTSSLFLVCYLYYHAQAGSTHFQGTGFVRTLYFTILISHTVLATVIVPLVLATFSFAWRGQYERHRRWARWTWPLWMYVSVTGVVVYWMLYRL